MSASPQQQRRAIEARDILSSFDRDKLPEEILSEGLFDIGRSTNTPEDRTIPGELVDTLFQHAAFDPSFFRELEKIQPAPSRQILFYQKIERRFRQGLESYDSLRDQFYEARVHLTVNQENEMNMFLAEINLLMGAIKQDLQIRRLPGTQQRAAEAVLKIIRQVCNRNQDVPLARTRADDAARRINLFERLIGRSSSRFGVDILEEIDGGVLGKLQAELNDVQGRLMANGAPPQYLQSFEQLQ